MKECIDVVYVTYNSSKWIEKCFASVRHSDYPCDRIRIIVVDNASSDDSIDKLRRFKKEYGEGFLDFIIIESKINLGFGQANNIGFRKGKEEIVFFLNIDTEVLETTFSEMVASIAHSDHSTALWELRQFPYEHPKVYDPLTMEVSWSSGAAFAVRRHVFAKVNGFDKRIFMYAEDVDLSWRIRSFGYKLCYVPRAVIMHYTYGSAREVKPVQFVNSLKNNLLLRYRFGSVSDVVKGHILFWLRVFLPSPFHGARAQLVGAYVSHFKDIPHFLNRKHGGRNRYFKGKFLLYDYEKRRKGAFFINKVLKTTPLVSVIVRSSGQLLDLRKTLISLRNQTYMNFEVIIIGKDKLKVTDIMAEEFPELNIIHWNAQNDRKSHRLEKIAVDAVSGNYLNICEEGAVFFADHLEVLVSAMNNGEERAAYSFALNMSVLEIGKRMHIPNQSIMIEKSLLEECVDIGANIDDLGKMGIMRSCSCRTDLACVEKTTSICKVSKGRK